MFETAHLKTSDDFDAALISGGQEDLMWYDHPILFTGLNGQGQRIIGSSVDFDKGQRIDWNFHAVVSDDVYKAFRERRMSYPDVLRCGQLFLVGYSGKERPILHTLAFDEIPTDYRPHENAMCPIEPDASDDSGRTTVRHV